MTYEDTIIQLLQDNNIYLQHIQSYLWILCFIIIVYFIMSAFWWLMKFTI